MNIKYIEEVPSFQQSVFKVEIEGTIAYSKRIISNYSWWTCEDTDIFKRETESYKLLNSIGVGPQLLFSDAKQGEFVVKELRHIPPQNECVEPFLDDLVLLLEKLRGFTDTHFQSYNAKEMATLFCSNGEKANVAPSFLNETTQMLNRWHDLYGSAVSYVHGDLHLGNIHSDGKSVTGIIDFEEAIQTIPVFDATDLSSSVMKKYGPTAYEYFRNAYEKSSGASLIDLEQWRRFGLVRVWIASCYLKNCCSSAMQEKAGNFLFHQDLEAIL
ncbi:MAG: aminoglycoside phosphotransferase family protein [Candidatus Sericytochromatia bacterium]